VPRRWRATDWFILVFGARQLVTDLFSFFRAASLESEVLEALMLVKVRPLFCYGGACDKITKSWRFCAIPGLCRNSGLMCGKEGGGSTITSVRMLIFSISWSAEIWVQVFFELPNEFTCSCSVLW
jgi:hypothetical protein